MDKFILRLCKNIVLIPPISMEIYKAKKEKPHVPDYNCCLILDDMYYQQSYEIEDI